MGSGLILLLIVGAWLAVLVPMALRSHDASALGTVDKFHDAMRVLARRESVGGSSALTGSSARATAAADGGAGNVEDGADSADDIDIDTDSDDRHDEAGRLSRLWTRVRALLTRPVRRLRRRPAGARRPLTPAARRRRTLLGLLAATALTLVGAVVGPLWLLVPHLVVDVLLVVFVCWLRASAVARAEREWRVAMGGRSTDASDEGPILPAEDADDRGRAERVAAPLAGLPDRLPTRGELAPRREQRVPEPREAEVPARGAQGQPWQPVPLPVPTYVTAPEAPVRRRVLDLTRVEPVLASVDRTSGVDDQGSGLEHVLGQRRAVGD